MFEELAKRFDVFSGIESVEKLETYFLPTLKAFTNGIKDLEKSNEEVRQVVQQFDYNLSLKVNKSAFEAIRHDLGKGFLKREDLVSVNVQLKELKKEHKMYENQMESGISEYKKEVD